MHITAPPIIPAPASRFGRHMRRTARRLAVAGAVTAATLLLLAVLTGPVASAIGLACGANVLFVGACRLLGSSMADAEEERWLRQALNGLQPADAEDEDPDLFVS
jgi:hypothetical protein